MGQLTKRVVLVHELGQLGRSEKLLNRCRNRLDIDQRLRGNALNLLCGHTLTNHTLQSGKADPVLVLQQFTDRTDTAVAQMVDIIVVADAVLQMDIVVDGCNDIFLRNVLRNQIVYGSANCILNIVNAFIFFQYFFKYRIIY